MLLRRDCPCLCATFGRWRALAQHDQQADDSMPALFSGLHSQDASCRTDGRPDAYTDGLDAEGGLHGADADSLQPRVPQIVPWTHSMQQHLTDRLREVHAMWQHNHSTGGLPHRQAKQDRHDVRTSAFWEAEP